MIGAIAAPPAERAREHLRSDVVSRPVTDPSHDIAPHRQPVPLIEHGEHRGLLDGSREQLGVR